MMGFRRYDLLLVVVLSLLQVALVVADASGAPRVAGGFLLAAFLPGYAVLALTERGDRRDPLRLDRVILAVPFSLAISLAVGLLLNALGVSATPGNHAAALAFVAIEAAVVAMARSTDAETPSRRQGIVFAMPALAALALGGVAGVLDQPDREPYAGLYLLDARGRMLDESPTVSRDEPFRVVVGVAYDADAPGEFTLLSPSGQQVRLTLRPGEVWRRTASLALSEPGRHRVTWTLTSEDGLMTTRSVALWVEVR